MDPIIRQETYLAKIAGEDVEIPEPITREEQYLYEIAMNGGTFGCCIVNNNSLIH